MNTEEMQDELEQAAEAPGHFFNGKRLQPFSFGRQACYQRCDDGESEFEAKITILFLCMLGEEIFESPLLPKDHKKSGIDIMEAARGAGIPFFRRLVAKWADENGFTANNPEGRAAAHLGFIIWNESKKSKFKPVQNGGSTPDPNG